MKIRTVFNGGRNMGRIEADGSGKDNCNPFYRDNRKYQRRRKNIIKHCREPVRRLPISCEHAQHQAENGRTGESKQPKVADKTRSEHDRNDKSEPESVARWVSRASLTARTAMNQPDDQTCDDPVHDKQDESRSSNRRQRD